MHLLSRWAWPTGFQKYFTYKVPLSNPSPCKGHRKTIFEVSPYRVTLPTFHITLQQSVYCLQLPPRLTLWRWWNSASWALPAWRFWLCAPSCFPQGKSSSSCLSGSSANQVTLQQPRLAGNGVPPTGDAVGSLLVTVGSRLCFCSGWKQRNFLEVQANICRSTQYLNASLNYLSYFDLQPGLEVS